MNYKIILEDGTTLYHHGIKGQKWGIRRYQNPDGSLTEAGRKRYLGDSEIKKPEQWYTDYAKKHPSKSGHKPDGTHLYEPQNFNRLSEKDKKKIWDAEDKIMDWYDEKRKDPSIDRKKLDEIVDRVLDDPYEMEKALLGRDFVKKDLNARLYPYKKEPTRNTADIDEEINAAMKRSFEEDKKFKKKSR